MSNSLLEQLYKGEIYPFAKLNESTEEQKELNQKISDEKHHFMDTVSKDDIKRFEELGDLELERSSAYGLENFTYGFRLGAKMILEIVEEKEIDF